ncbi:hypothetical protein F3087_00680 [Nocardia colli]|uniref:Uncharacterized protein n=1 Tax=Nocardia colli TaxID=2545717 RepID=A0A5N0EKF2_9NOCA|nr:hypothetical protein [Nocardia colli]KAA8889878.1 hypothetical protein F3087_00680 [Nocardia colli]
MPDADAGVQLRLATTRRTHGTQKVRSSVDAAQQDQRSQRVHALVGAVSVRSRRQQTPRTIFIINMVISGLHSYAGLN